MDFFFFFSGVQPLPGIGVVAVNLLDFGWNSLADCILERASDVLVIKSVIQLYLKLLANISLK